MLATCSRQQLRNAVGRVTALQPIWLDRALEWVGFATEPVFQHAPASPSSALAGLAAPQRLACRDLNCLATGSGLQPRIDSYQYSLNKRLELQLRYCSAASGQLPDTMCLLRNLKNGAEIFLIGTAHVSAQSAEEVKEAIRRIKPQTVMVELDPQRAKQLMSGQEKSGFSFAQTLASKLSGGSGGSWTQMLAGAGMSGMYRMLRLAGLDPGAEFKAAITEAQALGARIVYGDQDGNRTMERISRHLGLQNLMRMLAASASDPAGMADLMQDNALSKMSLTDQIEAMKSRLAVRKMSEVLRRLNPKLVEALIDERDQIMVDCLSKLEGTVVGVVGLGHLDGMERLWEQQKGD